MYFKVKNIFIIGAIVTLAACRWVPGSNLNVGENNPPSGKVAVDMNKFSCLRNLDQNVNDYFNSNLNEKQIIELAACVRSALERFEFLTKDSDDGTYTPSSLVNFINKEYLHDQKISPAFATELMAIKSLVLGGSLERISRDDLHELSRIITFVEKHAIAHLPYIKIYRHNSSVEPVPVSKQDLLNAQEQVRVTAQAVADILRKNKNAYSLASFNRLFDEARAFLKWEENHPGGMSSVQVMAIVRALKGIISGDESEDIRFQDWLAIADAASVAYGFLLNNEISMRGQKLTMDPALETFIGSINDVFLLLERIIKAQPSRVIRFAQTDKLLSSINNAGFLPNGIRESSLSKVYKKLVLRGFQKPSSLKPQEEIEGLGLNELKEMVYEFKLWADAQRYLSDNATQALGLNIKLSDEIRPLALEALSSFDFDRQIRLAKISNKPVNQEIELLINNLSPLFKSGDERAFLAPDKDLLSFGVQHDFTNLTRMNFMRGLVRLLIRSFASPQRAKEMKGLTENEMEEFYQTTKDLGEDLKLMEPPRHNGVSEKGKKYFKEAKMFTRMGSGISSKIDDNNDVVSFYETLELLSMMWSGGQIRNNLYKELSAKCDFDGFGNVPTDILNERKINRDCFKRHIADNNFEEFSNLPFMLNSIRAIPAADKNSFAENMEGVAKIACEDSHYIEQSELATMSTALHYVENIFTVYDKNQDGTLTSQDVMSAFPRFRGYLARQLKESEGTAFDDGMIKAIYVFIIKEKRKPEGLRDKAKLLWYRYWFFNENPNRYVSFLRPPPIPEGLSADDLEAAQSNSRWPEVSADRLDILKVLRVLAETSRSSAICE